MNSLEAWYVFWMIAPFAIVALGSVAIWAVGVHQRTKHREMTEAADLEEFVLESNM